MRPFPSPFRIVRDFGNFEKRASFTILLLLYTFHGVHSKLRPHSKSRRPVGRIATERCDLLYHIVNRGAIIADVNFIWDSCRFCSSNVPWKHAMRATAYCKREYSLSRTHHPRDYAGTHLPHSHVFERISGVALYHRPASLVVGVCVRGILSSDFFSSRARCFCSQFKRRVWGAPVQKYCLNNV